ncbi:MAG: TonB-dependent receptor [Pyrinomonadaceae bacterium]
MFNFANDAPLFETRDVDPRTGVQADASRAFRSSNYALYVQDDWKALSNLTLNLGLRYEYFSPISEANNRLSALILGTGDRSLLDARLEITDQLTEPDRNNFAPRVGFAYSPKFYKFLENRAVIRGGFGIFYNRIPNVLYTNTRLNPPFFARVGVCCGVLGGDQNSRLNYSLGTSNSPFSFAGNPNFAGGIDPVSGSLRGNNAEVYGAERRLPNSEVYKYSLDIQYELPSNFVASIGYEGSQSRNLIRIVPLNLFFRPRLSQSASSGGFAPVFFLRPDVNASYNGMNLRVERRFANNFQISANYRFAKSLDQLSYEGPGFVTNQTFPLDQRQEKGPSDYDVRHNFNLSGLYVLPSFFNKESLAGKLLGGFEISGILTTNTGFPFTPLIGEGSANAERRVFRTDSSDFLQR